MNRYRDPASIRTLRDYEGHPSFVQQVRSTARSSWMRLASLLRRNQDKSGWIRFPCYHHIFDDERQGFALQLRYFQNIADLISLDAAVEMLEASSPIRDRFFCLSFDDGFRNNLTNAVPILVEHRAVAAFFVPTMRIQDDRGQPTKSLPHASLSEPEYLTWGDCRAMVDAGMIVGSHTVSHARLSELSDALLEAELRDSKAAIEARTQKLCNHFACPWGKPGVDFSRGREPLAAAKAGYRSFLTSIRGRNHRASKPLMIERDTVRANWPQHQLSYFFTR